MRIKVSKYQSLKDSLKDWVKNTFIHEKLNNKLGIALFILMALFAAFVGAKLGLIFGLLFFFGVSGVLFLLITYLYPAIGFFSALVIPFIFFIAERRFQQDFPFGAAVQAILFVTLIFILFKKLVNRDLSFKFLDNNVTYAFLALFIYNLIQGLNPNVSIIDGWLLVVKGNLALLCTYIVGLYLAQDFKFIRIFVIIWLVLAFISAAYACYQEWFGLANFERNWIHADNLRFNRIFVQGKYRKFSLLSDPTAFGIFMASSSIVAFILATRPMKTWVRLFLLFSALVMFMAMGYSGTRTAYAMVPVGILIFGFMTITNRNTLILAIIGALGFLFILFGPIYGNATVNRIRSAFNSDDASLNIRDVNRHSIQPYIYDHPMGGGVMTTGDAGSKYNPNHPLAGFPPDSGYLKIALETGWVGLLLYMIFLFVGMRNGIKNFYAEKEPAKKTYFLAFTTFVFMISIALYAQTVTTQIPISIIFWPLMGILHNLKNVEVK